MANITLDPGHGGTSEVGGSSPNNAVGPNGTLEKDLVLDIGLKLRVRLRDSGHDVTMTRSTDVNLGLADRAEVAKDNDADVFVSIHFNGWHDPAVQGTETYVYPDSDAKNTRLASAVQTKVLACTGYRDRGVKSAA